MGQAPLQILAQQAGQFVQIWPGVMVGIARSIPLFAGLGLALAPVIAAFARVNEEASTMRQFTAELTLSADGGRYAAQELTKTALAMKSLGVSTDDAMGIVRAFMKEGFDTKQMSEMTLMAKQLADVTGMEIPDAAAKIAKAFSGNAESVRELDKELNFLTASQLEQIRAMDEAGDKAGALALAQDILQQKLKATVQPATDFELALKDLKSAWDALVTAVANSGIVELGTGFINSLGESARGWAFALNVLTKGYDAAIEEAALQAASDQFGVAIDEQNRKLAAAINKRNDLTKRLKELNDRLVQEQNINKSMFGEGAADNADIIDLKERIKFLNDELAKTNDEYDEITESIKNGAGEQEKATEAAKEATEATEEQAKAAADVDAVIQGQVKSMQEQLDLTLQTSKEQFIQNALLDARNAALEKAKELGLDFLGLTKEQTDAIREQAGLLFDAQQGEGFAAGLGEFSDGIEAAAAMLRQFEGFRANAYNDPQTDANGNQVGPNIYRAGYGSDTITLSDGTIKKITEGMTVSVEDANRDLARRIGSEFAPIVVQAIGKERFDQFAPLQQAALVSIAYNYGELPGRIVDAVRNGTNQEIASAIQGLGGDNGGINNGRRAKEASAFTDEVGVENNERLLEIEKERVETAKEYNENADKRLADKQFELELAGQEAREAAIAKAIRDEELEAQKAGVKLTKERRDEIARTTGALFDQQNVEAEVNRLMEQRAIIQEKLEIAQNNGDAAGVATAKNELTAIDAELDIAIDKAIAFWEAMGGSGAELAIEKLGLVKTKLQETSDELRTKYLPTAEEMNDRLAEIGANAFDKLAQKAAEGKLSFKDFFQALREGIAQFLIDIGRAIIKQALFNAISGGTKGGGAGGWLAGLLGKVFHEGGEVGGAAPTRMVNPMWFAGAMRYHSGGIAGMKPNEVPIIAEKGEEVLTESDPRHRNNMKDQSVKIVNVIDPTELLEKALASEVGERVLVNFMSRRSRQIGGVLG
jgi:GH24 family phage-related lysozyme (muramidase)